MRNLGAVAVVLAAPGARPLAQAGATHVRLYRGTGELRECSFVFIEGLFVPGLVLSISPWGLFGRMVSCR